MSKPLKSVFLVFIFFLISESVGDVCDDTIRTFVSVVENDTSVDQQVHKF